jgi:CheY-like chemotaxis protein
MANLLLVDDDRDQLELRCLALEQAGHRVAVAANPEEAVAAFRNDPSALVLMDLHLPDADDGRTLIRRLHEISPTARILVVSGWPHDFARSPEAALVDRVIPKPVRSEHLLNLLNKLAAVVLALAPALAPAEVDEFKFSLAEPAEMVALIEPARPQHELAELSLDGRYVAHFPLVAEAAVLLGRVGPGPHRLHVSRPVRSLGVRPGKDPCAAQSPILYARPNTLGRFTDVPLLAYCEQQRDSHGDYLQFSVIFSNEDGGTSTRALMARWGRTTDIEHVYRVWNDRAMIQSRGHQEVEFHGPYQDKHPLLAVVTDNNMVAPPDPGGGDSSLVRFAPAPFLVDLSSASREKLMDDHPWTYRVMSEELHREDKLRSFGAVDGQKISDPRNYLYLEARISNRGSRFGVLVRLREEPLWRASHLGHHSYTIERSGWVRTAIELPPQTHPEQIAEFGFECFAEQKVVAGECTLEEVSKAFLLDERYQPQPSFFHLPPRPRPIPSGHKLTFPAAHPASR